MENVRESNSDHNPCKLYNIQSNWYWDESANRNFSIYLGKVSTKNEFDKILSLQDADEMTREIGVTLNKAAGECRIAKKKQRNRCQYPNVSPWYDSECLSVKQTIIQTAKLIKRYPQKDKLREDLHILKKKHKSLVKKKKNDYKGDILDQVNCGRKNSTTFWNILKKIRPEINRKIFQKVYIRTQVEKPFQIFIQKGKHSRFT